MPGPWPSEEDFQELENLSTNNLRPPAKNEDPNSTPSDNRSDRSFYLKSEKLINNIDIQENNEYKNVLTPPSELSNKTLNEVAERRRKILEEESAVGRKQNSEEDWDYSGTTVDLNSPVENEAYRKDGVENAIWSATKRDIDAFLKKNQHKASLASKQRFPLHPSQLLENSASHNKLMNNELTQNKVGADQRVSLSKTLVDGAKEACEKWQLQNSDSKRVENPLLPINDSGEKVENLIKNRQNNGLFIVPVVSNQVGIEIIDIADSPVNPESIKETTFIVSVSERHELVLNDKTINPISNENLPAGVLSRPEESSVAVAHSSQNVGKKRSYVRKNRVTSGFENSEAEIHNKSNDSKNKNNSILFYDQSSAINEKNYSESNGDNYVKAMSKDELLNSPSVVGETGASHNIPSKQPYTPKNKGTEISSNNIKNVETIPSKRPYKRKSDTIPILPEIKKINEDVDVTQEGPPCKKSKKISNVKGTGATAKGSIKKCKAASVVLTSELPPKISKLKKTVNIGVPKQPRGRPRKLPFISNLQQKQRKQPLQTQESVQSLKIMLSEGQKFSKLVDEMEKIQSANKDFVTELYKQWIKKTGYHVLKKIEIFKTICKSNDYIGTLHRITKVPKKSMMMTLRDIQLFGPANNEEDNKFALLPPPILHLLKAISSQHPELKTICASHYEQSKTFLLPDQPYIKDMDAFFNEQNYSVDNNAKASNKKKSNPKSIAANREHSSLKMEDLSGFTMANSRNIDRNVGSSLGSNLIETKKEVPHMSVISFAPATLPIKNDETNIPGSNASSSLRLLLVNPNLKCQSKFEEIKDVQSLAQGIPATPKMYPNTFQQSKNAEIMDKLQKEKNKAPKQKKTNIDVNQSSDGIQSNLAVSNITEGNTAVHRYSVSVPNVPQPFQERSLSETDSKSKPADNESLFIKRLSDGKAQSSDDPEMQLNFEQSRVPRPNPEVYAEMLRNHNTSLFFKQ